jgi:hypothetical protein
MSIKTITLTGYEALSFCEDYGILPNKFNDALEDARESIPLMEAYDIAKEDPNLLWIKVSEEQATEFVNKNQD